MDVARYRFRAELRGSWRGVLITAIVLGLAGGLALAALAGARRTASAFPRLLEHANTGDVLVNPDYGPFSALDYEDLLEVRGVEGGTFFAGLGVLPEAPGGGPDFEAMEVNSYALRGAGPRRDQPLIEQGRQADPAAATEVVMSPAVAKQARLQVGDTVNVFAADFDRIQACEVNGTDCEEAFDGPVEITLVGLGRLPDEIAEPSAETGTILFTAAFLDEYPNSVFYWGAQLHLRSGTDMGAFKAAVSALVPDEPIAFETTDSITARFQDSVRPQTIALAMFGALVGAAALLFAALALIRQAAVFAHDRALLMAMGTGRRTLARLGLLHGVVLAIGGAVVAVTLAVAVSPMMLIGHARDAEPDPGVAVDGLVLAAGGLISVIALAAVSAVIAARSVQRRQVPATDRVSKTAALLAGIGGRPAAVVRARLAFERGAGTTAVPVRSTVATLAIATAGAVAAFTFAASLDHLLATPAEYGANWDVHLGFNSDASVESADDIRALATEIDENVDDAVADLLSRDDVDGVSVLAFAEVDVANRSVPALGIDVRAGSAHPSVRHGRTPAASDEIVLAARTMDRSSAHIGDHVEIGSREFEVVGEAIFPGFAEYPGQDPTDLGEGAWLTLDGLESLGTVFSSRNVLVDVADGVDRREAFASYDAAGFSQDGADFRDLRPSTIANLARVRSTPAVLAVALAVLGLMAAAHALVLSVRRRRPVLAILRAVGLDRRQIAATIAWQATWIAAAAIVVGVPAGIVLGRVSWSALIGQLGGASPAVVPILVTAATALGAVAAANLVAAIPARQAARTRAAVALRAE